MDEIVFGVEFMLEDLDEFQLSELASECLPDCPEIFSANFPGLPDDWDQRPGCSERISADRDGRFDAEFLKDISPEALNEIYTELFPEDDVTNEMPEQPPGEYAPNLPDDMFMEFFGSHGTTVGEQTNREVIREKPPEKSTDSGKKKSTTWTFISNFLFYFAIVSILFVAMGQFANSGEAKSAPKGILGYYYFTVLTSSMQPEIPKGSLIVTQSVTDARDIHAGDNIAYQNPNDPTVTHKVVEVYENYKNSGETAFLTQGVDNPEPDIKVVPASCVIGVVKLVVPELGWTLSYISQNLPKVFVLFGLIILASIALQLFFSERKKEKIQLSVAG